PPLGLQLADGRGGRRADGAGVRGGAGGRGPSLNRDPRGRPVGRDHLADQVPARDRAPLARVAGAVPVVAHHEVLPLRDLPRRVAERVAPVRLHVRLVELLAVDVDVPVPLLPGLPGQPDQPLHEHAARAADLRRLRRGVEDDDVAALRAPEAVAEAAGEHAVGEARLAAGGGPRAVERRLHRARRDPVRVDHPLLDREHDQDRADDRDEPVDRDPPAAGEARGQAVDGIPQRTCSFRQRSTTAWSPESSTSGTRQPRNSAGRVYCGYSSPPPSSAENDSTSPERSASAPGRRRAIASTSTIAGRSPFESTYGPIEIESVQRRSTTRSSKPS